MRYVIALAAAATMTAFVGASPVSAQTNETNLPWCKLVAGGETECVYKTFAECERWRQSSTGECVQNPRLPAPGTRQ